MESRPTYPNGTRWNASSGSVKSRFGALDILVNNAGEGVFRGVQDLTREDWENTIGLNLTGVFYCCHHALPLLRSSGAGYIIQISSLAGVNPFAGGSAYNASKFGLNGFSEAIMQDLRYENIRRQLRDAGQRRYRFRPRRRARRLEDRARRYRGSRFDSVTYAGQDPRQPGRNTSVAPQEKYLKLLSSTPICVIGTTLASICVRGRWLKMVRLKKVLDPTLTGRDAEDLEASLRRKIVGQDEAIEQIVNIYQTFLAGMTSPGRPIGNFLFLGPTGSGKTRLVEAAAETLAGDGRAVIKIDCAEFQHSHEIAKLIGSPPGYLGHRETHPLLSQEVLNQYHTDKMKLSFVLFDEIEKASDALWNLLLGVLDKATLTLGDNRRVDFSRALIFMTSNLGAGEMGSILRPNMGFAASAIMKLRESGEIDGDLEAKIAKVGVEAARKSSRRSS